MKKTVTKTSQSVKAGLQIEGSRSFVQRNPERMNMDTKKGTGRKESTREDEERDRGESVGRRKVM